MNRTTRDLAIAGVVTGLAGLVTSQATIWALQVDNPPVVAVASAVRDLTPGRLAIQLIHLVGHRDKPLLIAGTVTLLLALFALLGTQVRRRPLLVDLAYLLLGGVGLLAVNRLDDSTLGSGLAVVVGVITWLVVNRFLTGPVLAAGIAEEKADDTAAQASRRAFLLRSAGVAGVAFAAAVLGRISSQSRRNVEQARKLLRLPVTAGHAPIGAELLSGISPWRTPNEDFYLIHTALVEPSISPRDWELRVHGMVDNELTLTYADLVGRRLTEDWVTLCCVSNEVGGDLIGNAWWSGVLLRDVLAEAGVQAGADAVLQTSHDGWNCGTPLAALTDGRNAMLALAMNGKPLPIEHGFPVRTVVPGLYGYVSATKWVVDLEVTRFDRIDAYWTKRGWSEKGPVKTQSRIDVPRAGSTIGTGTRKVGGSAWAQHTGIEKVEFQLDGGPWQEAQLGAVPNVDTWVQWTGEVDLAEGGHTLVVRATDKSGETQTSVPTDVVPDGATGWHTVEFDAG
ncbi:molybdopterin-dependent oxidoreductase [Marmoricola sp. RAF53]|uniref:molybdopterin-dependent oxidoreductase n=1 Tax=Marmoricola sp. RAF53 TaxID=3233059 RepID=UPI003F9C439C